MIEFHSVDIDFVPPFHKNTIIRFLYDAATSERRNISRLNYIFTSDKYLLEINQQFLNHNYFTDVITFDNSDHFGVKGEVFISIEYVKANYMRYSLSYKRELLRCILHGLLHLLGYDDKNPQSKMIMRNKENHYLGLI